MEKDQDPITKLRAEVTDLSHVHPSFAHAFIH